MVLQAEEMARAKVWRESGHPEFGRRPAGSGLWRVTGRKGRPQSDCERSREVPTAGKWQRRSFLLPLVTFSRAVWFSSGKGAWRVQAVGGMPSFPTRSLADATNHTMEGSWCRNGNCLASKERERVAPCTLGPPSQASPGPAPGGPSRTGSATPQTQRATGFLEASLAPHPHLLVHTYMGSWVCTARVSLICRSSCSQNAYPALFTTTHSTIGESFLWLQVTRCV